MSGAWNTLCCIPATVDEVDNDGSEEQRQPLFDANAPPSRLYTENHQQVVPPTFTPLSSVKSYILKTSG